MSAPPIAALFAPRLCFVDVETTGTAPQRERVTEVGVVTVECDGAALRVEEWSSLVNPGVPIPAEIQWLTGISNDMVRHAPSFAELAVELAARLHGAVFVAHNARFDYGFLKHEFARAGITWRATTLCTVRLSRLLTPERSPHGLDAIIARYQIECADRHRALGDARVLWRFVQRLYQRWPADEIEQAVARLLARPSTPAHLPPDALDGIAAAPGVYLFYGLNAHPIYIGKSIDVAARVAGHFSADTASQTDARLSQETRRIEWEETAGEIGALLREAELVKTRLPAHNIALRRSRNQVLARLDDDGRPRLVPAAQVALGELAAHFGPFSARAAARRYLTQLAAQEGLCLKQMRLEGRAKSAADAPCFNRQLLRCRGCCVGEEPAAEHGARLRALLAPLQILPWPHAGVVALVERNAARAREDWHLFDRWCWIGTVSTLDVALALAQAHRTAPVPLVFEPDVYRIARLALQRVAKGRLDLAALDGAGPLPT